MSPTRFASRNRWIYFGTIVLLIALVVAGLLRYRSVRITNQTAEKANELADRIAGAGLPRPDVQALERALGNDGGQECEDPSGALNLALWQINLSNGATGPGQRPVIADSQIVRAEEMVLEVYCPEKLEEFRKETKELKSEETVKD